MVRSGFSTGEIIDLVGFLGSHYCGMEVEEWSDEQLEGIDLLFRNSQLFAVEAKLSPRYSHPHQAIADRLAGMVLGIRKIYYASDLAPTCSHRQVAELAFHVISLLLDDYGYRPIKAWPMAKREFHSCFGCDTSWMIRSFILGQFVAR